MEEVETLIMRRFGNSRNGWNAQISLVKNDLYYKVIAQHLVYACTSAVGRLAIS